MAIRRFFPGYSKAYIMLVAVMGLLLSAGFPSAHGLSGITFDSTANASCTPSCTTLTWSHTVGSGPNPILIVGLSSPGGFAAASVTYGSQSLTFITIQYGESPSAEMWYLLSPSMGTATITATGPFTEGEVGGSSSYFNVASVGSFNSANSGSTPGTPSLPVSVNVNANSGDLVVDTLAALNTGAGTWSAGTGQNQRWLVPVSGAVVGAGSDKPASSPVTMTWSSTNIYGWTLIAVQLVQAPTTECVTASTGGSGCFAADAGGFTSLTASPLSSISTPPPAGLTFPFGLFSFTIVGVGSGQTVHVTETLPSPLPAGTFSYYKFQSGAWTQFPSASLDSTRTVITLTFTADASGTVTDPGGPAITPPTKLAVSHVPVGGVMLPSVGLTVLLPWAVVLSLLGVVSVEAFRVKRRAKQR